ncbi:hypothetical protein Glove_140g25 [Diversispora epigaea]|uniref:Uncharacterized protein n=1 Tax=Diversispora epigaea TaxID=1348612 RepID=A0A397IXP4_9GLOM|nr:hypothetical protein Glove_140g25 [Diversispora epigaea]
MYDKKKNFQGCLKLAEEGTILYCLGLCYHDEIGTTKNEAKAFQWYLKSAEGRKYVGIIMWIISTGRKPFANKEYNAELAADVFNGLRPKINK